MLNPVQEEIKKQLLLQNSIDYSVIDERGLFWGKLQTIYLSISTLLKKY